MEIINVQKVTLKVNNYWLPNQKVHLL